MTSTSTHSHRYARTTAPRPYLKDLNHLGRGRLTLDAHAATPLDAPMHVPAEGYRLRFLEAKEASNGVA
ncbi:hypothetical protein GCM10022224_025320 [Nonomuraea antimicrobica]|uniref:Uncharacterized protein n=1 Tax=Nonomuraea antimicrobica TaxID=561173 RepID=A0ABP7BJC2_9ACTN